MAKGLLFDDLENFFSDLVKDLEKKVPYAAAFAQQQGGHRASSSTTQQAVTVETPVSGATITLWNGGQFFELAVNRFDPEDIKKKSHDLARLAMEQAPAEKIELDAGDRLVRSFEISASKPADKIPLKQKLAYAQELQHALEKVSKKVKNAVGVVSDVMTDEIFVNRNRQLRQRLSRIEEIIQVTVAGEEGSPRRLWDGYARAGGWEKTGAVKARIKPLVDDAQRLLGAGRLKPGFYDVVSDQDWSGMLAHEAFGHGTETDMFLKDRSAGQKWMGKQVASSVTTLVDDPTLPGEAGTFFFDHEGALAGPTGVVEAGILKRGLTDCYSSTRLGLQRSANGRRESWQRKAYARMTNTFFVEGESKPADIFRSVEDGIYLRYASNGMEDPHGWGIQCEGLWAQKIKKGKLTDEVCSPVIMTGFVPDILKSIRMVGNDPRIAGLGYCGKGHKEIVKNTMGGPHLLFRARLA